MSGFSVLQNILLTAGFQIPAYVVLMQISLLPLLPHLSETITKYSNGELHVGTLIGRCLIPNTVISTKLDYS